MIETILHNIIGAKAARIAELKKGFDFSDARPNDRPHRFRNALTNASGPSIIAEFKRASPSKGVINNAAEPGEIAESYKRAGAVAISVLTEEDFFNGSLDDLQSVRNAVDLPILRKDFVIDEFQIRESAAVGADAILLIAAILSVDHLKHFQALAAELSLDALVEVHDENEMESAVQAGATLIGVNNRNLRTFEVSLDVSRRLARLSPSEAILVSESGIRTHEDILELSELGYSAFLVGETLMRSGEPEMELARLLGR